MNIFSIFMFLDKNLNFCQDFLPNFDFFCKFVKKYKLQFIYVLMSFLFVSSYVSICILLKFMYSKFQLSNSKIWLSYEYLNMPHLLVNTLYIEYKLNVHWIHIEILQNMVQYIFNIYILNTYNESIFKNVSFWYSTWNTFNPFNTWNTLNILNTFNTWNTFKQTCLLMRRAEVNTK